MDVGSGVTGKEMVMHGLLVQVIQRETQTDTSYGCNVSFTSTDLKKATNCSGSPQNHII